MALRIGQVVSNVDPKGLGRVRVRTFEREDTPIDKIPFASYCSPGGGGDNADGAGFFWVPEVGQQVWVMYEEDDGNAPVWIGYAYGAEGGNKNTPIEAKAVAASEPPPKIIRSRGGNQIILDDRQLDASGNPTTGIRLTTQNGSGLKVYNNPDQGICLGFGQSGGCMTFTSKGLNLKTDTGAGLYVNDEQNHVKLTAENRRDFLSLVNNKFIVQVEDGIAFSTGRIQPSKPRNEKFQVYTDGIFLSSGASGMTARSGGSQKFVSTQDTIFQNSGSFNVNANQYNFTGQIGSNFTVDLISPGDGTGGGNLQGNTTLGNVLFRVGSSLTFLPRPSARGLDAGFGADSLTMTRNDPAEAAGKLGRMGIGIQGNALLEGRAGGFFISGIPLPFPSSVGFGRLPIINAPISPQFPTPVPPTPTGSVNPAASTGVTPTGGPQPVVMGASLHNFLGVLVNDLLTLANVMLTAAPSWAVSPMGPTVLNPLVVTQLTNLVTDLTLLNTRLSTPANPSGILSGLAFVDG